jgi:hypothetical protein
MAVAVLALAGASCDSPPPPTSYETALRRTRLLTQDEFQSTFVEPMRNVTETAFVPPAIGGYLTSIPGGDLQPHWLAAHSPELIYDSGDNSFEHVLFPTQTKNVYLVIIVALKRHEVFGHFVLDLNREYGLPTPPRTSP